MTNISCLNLEIYAKNNNFALKNIMLIQETITRILEPELIEKIQGFIDGHQNFIVTTHMSPDGDAVGSSVAMTRFLRAKGKQATIIFNDTPGENLSFIPGVKDCLVYDRGIDNVDCRAELEKALHEADAIVSLDYNTLSRLGNMSEEIGKLTVPRLLIDHHLDPNRSDFDIIVSRPELSAACEVLYRVILETGNDDLVTRDIAEPLYCGMMTDTGGFVYSSERPDVYLIVARLLQTGFNKEELHRKCALELERKVRLRGYCLYHKMVILREHRTAFFSLSTAELKRFNHQKGDTESFVNAPLDIDGIQVSAFFREEKNFVKVSLRSKGDYPVNLIAEKFFNGGGHKNAAGGEYMGSLQSAERLFQKVLPMFDKYL